MVNKAVIFCILSLIFVRIAKAQQAYYFIYFDDKPNYSSQKHQLKKLFSQKAIERRVKFGIPLSEQDVPTDSSYKALVISKGAKIIGESRWFNGVLVLAEPTIISDSLKKISFIKQIEYAGKYQHKTVSKNSKEIDLDNHFNFLEQTFKIKQKDSSFYGQGQQQIELLKADFLHQQGYFGNNISIAVFDAGFKNANHLSHFNHLITNSRIKYIYDFVDEHDDVFDDDEHGLAVLSCMAAYKPGQITGTAPNADFFLFRTENAPSENLVEEYFWLLAAEFADSAGVDLINSSLGYTKHDEKSMGHTYSQLNGKTTVITKAAEYAAQKGMLVFVSAGNEGNDPWRYLAAPADAESAISVGAVDSHGHYAGFSSIGPTADKRLKPDLVALGRGAAVLNENGKVYLGNGTSYASPILCGATALLVQKYPEVHPQTIKNALLWSGNNSTSADKYIGYGVPDFKIADFILADQQIEGIAFARTLNDVAQIIVKSAFAQKVKITIYNQQGESITQNFTVTKKGLNALLINISKKQFSGKIAAVNAAFQLSNQNTWFRFN